MEIITLLVFFTLLIVFYNCAKPLVKFFGTICAAFLSVFGALLITGILF